MYKEREPELKNRLGKENFDLLVSQMKDAVQWLRKQKIDERKEWRRGF